MIAQLQEGPRGTVHRGHVIEVMHLPCAICGGPFRTDDEFILVPQGPLNEQEAAKMERGEPFMASSNPGHWTCLLGRWMRMAVWPPGYTMWGREVWRGPGVA